MYNNDAAVLGHQQSDPGQAAWNQQYYGQQGQQQPGYQQGAYATQYQQPAQPQPQPAQTSAAPAVNPQTGMQYAIKRKGISGFFMGE